VIEPIELRFTVACSAEHAFHTWANRTSLWWPHQHSFSGDPGLAVTFEPRVGGRIYERTPAGIEHDWGEVVAWEPPGRLVYLWHLATEPSDATEVEVTFAEDPAGTTVTVVHRGWDRLGAKGAAWRERNQAGWDGVLPSYRGLLERDEVPRGSGRSG
jgi:uncharacterized protein YndB with AHSA1/START domain